MKTMLTPTTVSTDYEITVYTQPVCPQCKTTKSFLEKNNITFVEASASESPEVFDIIKENNLRSQAPITIMKNVVSGKIEKATSGFNKRELENMTNYLKVAESGNDDLWDF